MKNGSDMMSIDITITGKSLTGTNYIPQIIVPTFSILSMLSNCFYIHVIDIVVHVYLIAPHVIPYVKKVQWKKREFGDKGGGRRGRHDEEEV